MSSAKLPSLRTGRALVLVALVVASAVAIVTSPASASGSPQFEPELYKPGGLGSGSTEVFATRAHVAVIVRTGGQEVKWHAEYAPAEGGHEPAANSSSWIVAGSGGGTGVGVNDQIIAVLTEANEQPVEEFEGHFDEGSRLLIRHLTPDTIYYARFHAENPNHEAAEKTFQFITTAAAKPEAVLVGYVASSASGFACSALSPATAECNTQVEANGAQTEYHIEYALPEAGHAPAVGSPAWAPLTFGEVSGTVAATPFSSAEGFATPRAEGGGLAPETTYYARVRAGNAEGAIEDVTPFTTFSARPQVEKVGVTDVTGASAHLESSLVPHGLETKWRFEYASSVIGPWSPVSGAAGVISQAEAKALPEGVVRVVEGDLAGLSPGKTYYVRLFAEDEAGEGRICHEERTPGPKYGQTVCELISEASTSVLGSFKTVGGLPVVSTFAVHGLHGEALRVMGSVNPEGSDTHVHFEYVSQQQFEEPGSQGGFAKAASTAEVDLGAGVGTEYVGADLPGLKVGETYRFRVVAASASPGDPVVGGEEQSLKVPVPPASAVEEPGGCPNEALRTGPSAQLPDCRAFELVTPVDKEGAQEIFNYGGSFNNEGAQVGEDGDHLEYASSTVKYGSGPKAGQSPYFFSRTEAGWQMTAATVQPEAGVSPYVAQVLGPDLSEFAFEAGYATSPAGSSPQLEFKVGAPGGPYTTVASESRSAQAGQEQEGWVAASADFSKLVLQVRDHTLLGHSTHTVEGTDLYEYSAGQLRQANVTGGAPGSTIGDCGARIADFAPTQGRDTLASLRAAPSHTVSADGSHVFFEAVPAGAGCSEPKHVYERVDGGAENATTVDLGAYRFVAADAQGSSVLLEKSSGENPGLYLYQAGVASAVFLPSSGVAVGAQLVVPEDLSAVYIVSGVNGGALYRYDISAETLGFVTQFSRDGELPADYSSSPDGRFFYFEAESVAGLPGGGQVLVTPHAAQTSGLATEAYRYDSDEQLIQCLSCASSFDPEPRLSAILSEEGTTTASANGEYVFFDTSAALLPSDVDGEVAPETQKYAGGEHGAAGYSNGVSVSSDVYEWRRDGAGGCSQVSGCLALITSGNGGFLNLLLGTDATGDDVFFATAESLLPRDGDTAEDIYDARINGGFAEAAHPVECRGDSCSTPSPLPPAQTPATLTLLSGGNFGPEVKPPAAAKAKPKKQTKKKTKAKQKKKKKKKKKKKRKRKKAKNAKKAKKAKAGLRGEGK